MRVAADRLATVTEIGQQPGLVPHANLTHLDPRLVFFCQLFDQLAKIDPLFGEVIENDPLTTEESFDVDELHLQPFFSDQLLAVIEGDPLLSPDVVEVSVVIIRGGAEDAAAGVTISHQFA